MAAEYQIEVPSIAMSGFYGQSFLKHRNYRVLIDDCIKTMQVMGAKIAYLPLGDAAMIGKQMMNNAAGW